MKHGHLVRAGPSLDLHAVAWGLAPELERQAVESQSGFELAREEAELSAVHDVGQDTSSRPYHEGRTEMTEPDRLDRVGRI